MPWSHVTAGLRLRLCAHQLANAALGARARFPDAFGVSSISCPQRRTARAVP
jgi:hypothetical protein